MRTVGKVIVFVVVLAFLSVALYAGLIGGLRFFQTLVCQSGC